MSHQLAPAMPQPRYPDTLLTQRKRQSFTLRDFTPCKGGVLGTGRFGTVHKVVENRSGRTLVLKKVSKKGLIEEGAVRQFQREVEIHCRIHHPNITKMYAYFHDASNCYLLLELADLGTLYSKVASGRLGEREAACIFRQLACAVAHMHRRGVIHRDIKPENVFLNCGQAGDRDETQVKLGDLGWSIVKRATSKRTTLCGTMEYLPPEVCRGAEARVKEGEAILGGMQLSEEYDEGFDLYTLGALLYEMLVGHSPFAGPQHAATPGAMGEVPLMKRILAGTFGIPHWLHRDVHVLIRQLMSQTPKARPSAAAILSSPWVVKWAGATDRTAWDY